MYFFALSKFSNRKRLDKNANVNFKTFDVINCETNNTILILILPKSQETQLDNEI